VLLVVAATERELSVVEGVETLCCGIGPVEAALATARRLAADPPGVLLHIGIAGALTLEPPALVIGCEAVYCDIVDAASRMPLVERAAPSPELLAAARRALPGAHVLPIGTAARVGGGRTFEVEAMEGFSVLRSAEVAGIPALEVRAVSNLVDQADRSLWRIDDALDALGGAVEALVQSIAARRLPT
jgi:futalosine hydrolase